MSSHWVAVKPNHSTSSNKELMDKINKKIDEQIECYELNVNGAEDDYIKANLKLIKDLAQNIKNSDDAFLMRVNFTAIAVASRARGYPPIAQ